MTRAEWNEFKGDLTDADIRDLVNLIKKRFWIYLLLSLIPGVGLITAGCAVYCYNNYKWFSTMGNSTGNNIVRFILMLPGALIMPIIEVWLFSHISALGNKVLGL